MESWKGRKNDIDILIMILRWVGVLILAWLCGKLITKIKMPAILGWLIAGMLLGPYGAGMLSQPVLDSGWYKIIITWMQCAFGLMLGTELIWTKIESYGRALILTTLAQSLGTFAVVSVAFALVLHFTHQPVWLAPAFGGIALATAPAPALSIVQEFHTKGPVTDTLLPMAVLDDIVGIAVFFTVNSFIASRVSGGAVPLYMIPVMILLPIAIGMITGIPAGMLLKKKPGKAGTLLILVSGITLTAAIGFFLPGGFYQYHSELYADGSILLRSVLQPDPAETAGADHDMVLSYPWSQPAGGYCRSGSPAGLSPDPGCGSLYLCLYCFQGLWKIFRRQGGSQGDTYAGYGSEIPRPDAPSSFRCITGVYRNCMQCSGCIPAGTFVTGERNHRGSSSYQ